MSRIKIGVSQCLVGDKVRFDGQGKTHKWIRDELAHKVELIKFCPELAMGLGSPRSALRLVEKKGSNELCNSKSGEAIPFSRCELIDQIPSALKDLRGYILKKGSPSCGLSGVKLYTEQGSKASYKKAQGVFAESLKAALPYLPIVEEGYLYNKYYQRAFLEAVELYDLILKCQSQGHLQRVHALFKYSLMARDQILMRKCGALLARPESDLHKLKQDYLETIIPILLKPPNRGGVSNTLLHLFGYFKRDLGPKEKIYFLKCFEQFNGGSLSAESMNCLLGSYQVRFPKLNLVDQMFLKTQFCGVRAYEA